MATHHLRTYIRAQKNHQAVWIRDNQILEVVRRDGNFAIRASGDVATNEFDEPNDQLLSNVREGTMTKEELLEKHQAGFTFGEGCETQEIIVNKVDTDDDCLHLWAYDASFMPLPAISKWSKEARNKLAKQLLDKLSDLNADVWIDDLQIMEKQQ